MNTYCKIPQYGLNTSNYDFLEDIPFDPISIEFIPGCQGDCNQLNCYCLTRSGYHQFELHNTFEFIDGRTICSRLYKIEQLPGLGKSTFWMTYKGQIISKYIKQFNIIMPRNHYLVQLIEHPILRILNLNLPNLRCCKVFFSFWYNELC